jgi:DNA repair protein RadD
MRQTLRPDQQRVVDEVFAFARAGRKRVLVWAPTGMGKTTVLAAIAERAQAKGSRAWALVHRHEIADQVAARLRGQDVRVGVCMGQRSEDPDALTQVISLQTLAARVAGASERALPGGEPDLVFVDEAHHLVAQTWWRALEERCGRAHMIFLSATPWGKEGEGLGIADALVLGPKPEELVAMGVLVPPEIYCGPAPDTTKITVRAGEFANDVLAEASTAILGDVVGTWQRLAAGKRTLAFAVNVAHSMALVERFTAAGVSAAHVDWATDPEQRRGIFAKLASGEILVVSNVGIVTEGFDCPAVDVCLLARATRSDKLYLQMVGRALRASPGKTKAIVLDHGSNAYRHGHPFLSRPIHLIGGADPKRTPKEKEVRERATFVSCGECMLANKIGARECIGCGARIVRTVAPKEKKAVELVRFTDLSEDQRSAFKIAERRVRWFRIVQQAAKSGWSPWRASYQYKSEFGIMPHDDQIFSTPRERGMYWMERKRKAS